MQKVSIGKRILKVLLIVLISLIALVSIIWYAPYLYSEKENISIDSSKWMSNIDDNVTINNINIPGSHDAGTNYVDLAFTGRTQSEDIQTQLNQGFRYFDIRLDYDNNDNLILVHSFLKCREGMNFFSKVLTLDAILDDMYEFLEDNPSETILFVVKNENGKDQNHFNDLLEDTINDNESFWYTGDIIPSLGDVRGKLVYFRRYIADIGLYFDWNGQGNSDQTEKNIEVNDEGNYLLYVQDRYKYDNDDKWNAFINGLSTDKGDENFGIHFLSTAGNKLLGHPILHALNLNKRLLNTDLDEYGTFGYIIIDYTNEELAKKVYLTNY